MNTPKDKAKKEIVDGFEWFQFFLNAVRGEADKELKKIESIETARHFLSVTEALIDILGSLFHQAGSIIATIKSDEERLDRHELNDQLIEKVDKKVEKMIEVSLSGDLFTGVTEECDCGDGMAGEYVCPKCVGTGFTTYRSKEKKVTKHQVAKAMLRETLRDMIVKEMKNPEKQEEQVTLNTGKLRRVAKKRGKK